MTGAELSLLDFIQTHLRSDLLDTLMVWISALGNGGAVWLALGLALLLRRKTRRVGICLLLALALSAAACSISASPAER